MAAGTTGSSSIAAGATAAPEFALALTPAHLRYADAAALPDSTRRLAAVLMHQDSDVSIVDVRAVLRALADGIDHTVYVLDRGHHEAAEVTRATRLLREAKTPITTLARLTAAARTLTPMRMDVQLMARETATQLLAVAGQAAGADRPAAQRRPIPDLGARALRWAAETPLVTDAIDRSLHAAVRAGRVAVRRTGEVQWVIASSHPDRPCPRPAAGRHERSTRAGRCSPRARHRGQSPVTPLGKRCAGRRTPRGSRTRAAGRGARGPSQQRKSGRRSPARRPPHAGPRPTAATPPFVGDSRKTPLTPSTPAAGVAALRASIRPSRTH